MIDEKFREDFNEYIADFIKKEIIIPFLIKEGYDQEIIDCVKVNIR